MRFHLASECTTWACALAKGMSNPTGRSTPLRSSFRPEEGSTNSGADTRLRFSSRASVSWNTRLIRLIALCVWYSERCGA